MRVQVIASYLCDKYKSEGASFELPSPEDRANDLLARRVHDLYIGPIQVCPWYKLAQLSPA